MIITTAELKKIILKQLKTQSQVDLVDELTLTQQSETIDVYGKIVAKGHDIEFSGELQNAGRGIELENSNINAGFFVKAFIRPYLKQVPDLVKKFLEKQYGKKFSSISITGKGLKLTVKD